MKKVGIGSGLSGLSGLSAIAGAAATWTPASPTTDGGVSPHTWLLSDTGLYTDAGKTTPATNDGDLIRIQENQGSDTFDLGNSVVDRRPILRVNKVNGENALEFDGSYDEIYGAFSGGAISQPYTVFIVSQLDVSVITGTSRRTMLDGDDGSNRALIRKNQTENWGIYAGATLDGTAADANWNIHTVLFNDNNSRYWLNGDLIAGGDAGAQEADGWYQGSSQGNNYWYGYIAEIVVYGVNLSDADKNQVLDYLSARFNIAHNGI